MVWDFVPLSEALEFKEGPGILATDFREQGIPLIRLAGLKSSGSLLKGCNFLDSSMVRKRWKHFQVSPGDVLLSTSASLGEVAIVTKEDEAGAIPYTGIIRFRPVHDRLAPRYLYYYFKSKHFAAQVEAMGAGSVMKHFGPTHLSRMVVTLPPRHAQDAIAEVLGALDDKIAANSELVDISTELAQSVTTLALSAGDTVALASVANVTMGSSPKGTTYNEVGDGRVLYQGIRDFGVRFPTPRVWTTEPVRRAAEGDLLLSVRAPVGALNVANSECCIGRGLAAMGSATPSALYHVLLAQPALFDSFNGDGTIFGSINKNHLLGLRVKVPVGGLATLDKSLAPIELCVAAALRESVTLAQLRDTLLPALMDGRIRVRDAIEQAEEVL